MKMVRMACKNDIPSRLYYTWGHQLKEKSHKPDHLDQENPYPIPQALQSTFKNQIGVILQNLNRWTNTLDIKVLCAMKFDVF